MAMVFIFAYKRILGVKVLWGDFWIDMIPGALMAWYDRVED